MSWSFRAALGMTTKSSLPNLQTTASESAPTDGVRTVSGTR